MSSADVNLNDIVRSQPRLETKIDLILERLEKSDAPHETLRGRVGTLEKDLARTRGLSAAIASLAGIGTGFLVPLLLSKLGI